MDHAKTASTRSNGNPQHLIDDYALARIDYRVGRLARAFRLGEDDAADLRQDMVAELLKAGARYNPDRSCRHTFVSRTLDRCYLHVARALSNREKHGSMHPTPVSAIPDFAPTINDPGQGEPSETDEVDLAIDLGAILPSLPPPLQRLGEELRLHKPGEAARRLGMHRSTIYRAIREIRGHFVAAGLGGES